MFNPETGGTGGTTVPVALATTEFSRVP
jgi:hypothetical protein